jgi:hypothetical protein
MMSDESRPASPLFRFKVALVGGLVAGTIDIGAACAINRLDPITITHAIASGLLGSVSFKEGAASAWLGLGLQWTIGITVALIYGYAVDLFPGLRGRWVTGGLIAGVVTFFVMNYPVLRLSALGHVAHFTVTGFIENFAAILVFGLIIAYFSRTRKTP